MPVHDTWWFESKSFFWSTRFSVVHFISFHIHRVRARRAENPVSCPNRILMISTHCECWNNPRTQNQLLFYDSRCLFCDRHYHCKNSQLWRNSVTKRLVSKKHFCNLEVNGCKLETALWFLQYSHTYSLNPSCSVFSISAHIWTFCTKSLLKNIAKHHSGLLIMCPECIFKGEGSLQSLIRERW